MLVVSRKTNEFVQIGESIVVKIIKTGSGSVKIGIDAPGGTRVLRGELAMEPAPRTAPGGEHRRTHLVLRGELEVQEVASVL